MEKLKIELHRDGGRPAVMWYWNDRLNEEDIIFQIHKFKEAGIYEFYIHPMWGLECDGYLSERFMRLIRLACDEARRLGMTYSIYDEYSWASGVCAGRLTEEHPDKRMTMLRWQRREVQSGEPLELWFRGDVLTACAQYADKAQTVRDITEQARVESFAGDGGRLLWENKSCTSAVVYLFCKFYPEGITAACKWATFTHNTRGFSDTMDPETTQMFLEMNNGRYREYLADRFGSTVRRVFTDETSMASIFDLAPNVRPWSNVLEREFAREHGYELRENLIALAEGANASAIRVRYDYHRTCTRLFCEGYLRQYADWCHENGLIFTGHMSGEGLLYYHTMQMGDFYEALSRLDVPGIDSIFSRQDMDRQDFGLEAKLLASVAKFAGKRDTMCETFSGSGWELSLEEAKRIINRLMLGGVSYIIYMGGFMSLSGGRKSFPMGYPPSHGWNNTLFRHYGALSDYAAARSSVISATEPCARTLLFLPQTDAWVYTEDCGRIDLRWRGAAVAMRQKNIDFDFFFEPLAKRARAVGGRIIIGDWSYDTVILPYVRCSTQAALELLRDFVEQGGRVVYVDSVPDTAADTGEGFMLCEARDFWQGEGFAALDRENALLIRMGGECGAPAHIGRLGEALERFIGREGEFAGCDCGDGVYLARRSAPGLDCCLIMNDSEEARRVCVTVTGSGRLRLLDGCRLCEPDVEEAPSGRRVRLRIAPHDMPVLMLEHDGAANAEEDVCGGEKHRAYAERTYPLDGGWRLETAGKNLLPLRMKYLARPDGCDIARLTELAESFTASSAAQELPPELTYGDRYAAFARFDIVELSDGLEIFSEISDGDELWLNGVKLGGYRRVREWGVRDSVTDISHCARRGGNILLLLSRVPEWKGPHRMPSVVVRGDFRLDGERIARLTHDVRPESYTAQGWRYFGGEVSYKTQFMLNDKDNFEEIILKVNTRDVVEAVVNGESAGTRLWRPYEWEIAALCREGANTLELRFTTGLAPTMLLEDIELTGQGFAVYRGEQGFQPCGLLSAPELTEAIKQRSGHD